jgi:hypothetical protein
MQLLRQGSFEPDYDAIAKQHAKEHHSDEKTKPEKKAELIRSKTFNLSGMNFSFNPKM